MSLSLGRSFYQRPSFTTPYRRNTCNPHYPFLIRSLCMPSGDIHLNSHSVLLNLFSKSSVQKTNNSLSRAIATHASLAKRGRRTIWDEAADSFFSEASATKSSSVDDNNEVRVRAGTSNQLRDQLRELKDGKLNPEARPDSNSSDSWERDERESFRRHRKPTSNSIQSEGPRWKEGRAFNGISEGVKRWGSVSDRELKDFGSKSGGYERERNGRTQQWQISGEVKDLESKVRYGGEKKYGADYWQRRRKEDGPFVRQNEKDNSNMRSRRDGFTGQRAAKEDEKGSEERGGFGDERRWQSREYSPPIQIEGQALYGVAPIISALQASRRTFYSLYLQESLLQNMDRGKRKDKAAVLYIEKTAKSLGLAVKEASKHNLNMLVDSRPHQGLVLDASPLEMIPVDMLDPPLYEGSRTPVWVALDEVNDPQNFGAILRSAYFLGASGVVVCAKNSAPLSGVVSKASAGAMEVMEVRFCKNMMKFLDKSRENGWRVIGASTEPISVPIRQLPSGVPTVLVFGNEGKGMRTNVKRACDQLVSISGISDEHQGQKNIVLFSEDSEETGLNPEEDDGEESVRSGAELSFLSGPLAVDSLNVSVAAGIMLHELMSNPIRDGAAATHSC